ncbi:hypothetical protein CKO18_05915 [Rhodoferax fermentans]|uniref:Uncharacterized protein n=1 Tax=Rhodoferax fermentans TaxID=28066 RepID=A0A1T1ANM7_RHOFE|nr:hypothetical protein [Rhodoferax fermentans]OOV05732.1 hypothetical protein RF819_02560 [Rhodoferax fermentans]
MLKIAGIKVGIWRVLITRHFHLARALHGGSGLRLASGKCIKLKAWVLLNFMVYANTRQVLER